MNMTLEEKISFISTKHMLTIKQWDDKWKHYRVGINWNYKTGDVEFLIERPTLEMAIDDVIEVIQIGFKNWQKANQERIRIFMTYVKEYLELSKNSIKNSDRLKEIEVLLSKRDVLPKENISKYLERYKHYHSYQEVDNTRF